MSREDPRSTLVTEKFTIPFGELALDTDDIARCMGYVDGMAGMPFAEQLNGLLAEVGDHVCLEGGFRIFTPDLVRIERDKLFVENIEFDTGRIIAGPLRGAESLAFFVATAGPGLTRWADALMEEGEHVLAYFVDALGSETVEKAADWLEAKIDAWAAAQEEPTTNRYSPGYCDWHVSEQHKFFSLLPEDFCGITLTESALMQPTKSVSGVIGIGGKAKKRAYACSICSMEQCFRRKTKTA